MPLSLEAYRAQTERWPRSGRHLLAQHDARAVVVYQAYNPRIGRFAAENRFFGGDFKLTRMSWKWILDLEDITPSVREQREHVRDHRLDALLLPQETVFQPAEEATARRLELAPPPG